MRLHERAIRFGDWQTITKGFLPDRTFLQFSEPLFRRSTLLNNIGFVGRHILGLQNCETLSYVGVYIVSQKHRGGKNTPVSFLAKLIKYYNNNSSRPCTIFRSLQRASRYSALIPDHLHLLQYCVKGICLNARRQR